MKYYVVWPDGQKFGPADVDVLNQWISEGRVSRESELESAESGARLRAADVPGLQFPAEPEVASAAPTVGSTYGSNVGTPGTYTPPERPAQGPAGTPYGSPQTPYQNPYQNPPQGYAYGDDGSKDVTYSFVCSIIGFFCCCFLTIFGAYLGNRAKQKGHPNGNAAFITAIVLLIISMTISAVYMVIVFPQLQQDMLQAQEAVKGFIPFLR